MSALFYLLDRGVLLLGLFVTASLVAHFGFPIPEALSLKLSYGVSLTALLFVAQEIARLVCHKDKHFYWRHRWFEFLVGIAIVVYLLALVSFVEPARTIPAFSTGFTLAYLGLMVLLGFFATMLERVQTLATGARVVFRPAQIFLISFLAPIGLGSLLLKMPKAVHGSISWVDAIFTAASAVCVTGLSVVDTGRALTPLGQVIVCILYQIGGLGIMTLTITFASFFAGGIGIRERIMMSDLLSEDRIGEIRGLLARICGFTFVIEAAGAVLLYLSSGESFLYFNGKAFLASLFHSVAAFCNAGFSLMPQSLYDPDFRQNFAYASVIAVLIVLGGLGFPVLANVSDLLSNHFAAQRKYRVATTTTKLVLSVTATLLTASTCLIWLFESKYSFSALPVGEQLFQSLFLAVTARTAGFSLWPTEALSVATLVVLMVLMWIGGSPMSTAGGVKNTTVFVSLLNIRSQVMGIDRVEVFGRQIQQSSLNRASAAIAISIVTLALAAAFLLFLEDGRRPLDCVFEVLSAWSTVGLSRGSLTAELRPLSKLLLTVVMLVGRVGAITVLSAFIAPPKSENYKLLEDSVIVY